ncbi:saccharopine dehydrogenase family protein [Patulibacter minatonensis]|uniref:saccharopine dehydrogenase family protein n=1 Tax=Patulibacter minatonensis TaxID=298163 RepID=UPI000478D952|nr:saccharopine dehydrogenase NADP-binding domain-containing protein [Patulibacter minatonensis]
MSAETPAPEREHDLVVFGATGFVGRLTALYLAEHAPSTVKVALAGRSRAKLESIRETLPGAAREWPVVVADSHDPVALGELARSTRVVITTVGPYARYGLPLVAACAEAGTHYADLTGETLFMRKSIDSADAVAKESGARIVHTAGFDSIPSDLGVLALHDAAQAAGAGELAETTFVVVAMSGGLSGGTIDSLRNQLDEGRADKDARRLAADPYALSPDRSADPDPRGERDPTGVSRDPHTGAFLAPFVMGTVNTRVVRRSNALQGYAYGRGFRYQELMSGGKGPLGAVKAGAIVAALAGVVGGLSVKPTRKVLDRMLPDPGEGPSEAAREKGFFRIDITTTTASGRRFRCRIAASGDPGYKATAVMLGQAGLCLLQDEEKLPKVAGVLTPATAMGNVLTDRLRAVGHSYDVTEL